MTGIDWQYDDPRSFVLKLSDGARLRKLQRAADLRDLAGRLTGLALGLNAVIAVARLRELTLTLSVARAEELRDDLLGLANEVRVLL